METAAEPAPLVESIIIIFPQPETVNMAWIRKCFSAQRDLGERPRALPRTASETYSRTHNQRKRPAPEVGICFQGRGAQGS